MEQAVQFISQLLSSVPEDWHQSQSRKVKKLNSRHLMIYTVNCRATKMIRNTIRFYDTELTNKNDTL